MREVVGVIICAGYGTRFLPVTKTVPKELLPLLTKPILQFTIDEFLHSGISRIVIVSSRRKRAIEDYLDREMELWNYFLQTQKEEKLGLVKEVEVDIAFVRQVEMRGVGDALLKVYRIFPDNPLLVAYPDDVFIGEYTQSPSNLILQKYKNTKKSVIAIVDRSGYELQRYGVVKIENGEIKGIVEKPKEPPSTKIMIGRYLLVPEFLEELEREYERFSGKGEFHHIGLLNEWCKRGKVDWVEIDSSDMLDVGEPEGYLESFLIYAKRFYGEQKFMEILRKTGLL